MNFLRKTLAVVTATAISSTALGLGAGTASAERSLEDGFTVQLSHGQTQLASDIGLGAAIASLPVPPDYLGAQQLLGIDVYLAIDTALSDPNGCIAFTVWPGNETSLFAYAVQALWGGDCAP